MLKRPAMSQTQLLCCVGLSLVVTTSVAARVKSGQFSHSAEQNCILGGKLNAERCANAAANAQAEFEPPVFLHAKLASESSPPGVATWASKARRAGRARSPASISHRATRAFGCWRRRRATRRSRPSPWVRGFVFRRGRSCARIQGSTRKSRIMREMPGGRGRGRDDGNIWRGHAFCRGRSRAAAAAH